MPMKFAFVASFVAKGQRFAVVATAPSSVCKLLNAPENKARSSSKQNLRAVWCGNFNQLRTFFGQMSISVVRPAEKVPRLLLLASEESDVAVEEEEEPKIVRTPNIDKYGRSYGTGRRKTAAARVWVKEGSGQLLVNGQEYNYPLLKIRALEPLKEIDMDDKMDVICTVKGGGVTGQTDAIRHGLARALNEWDPEFRGPLKKAGMLTRDPRMVERKKYGLKKARKGPQWAKR